MSATIDLISLHVNGAPMDVPEATTVAALLTRIGLNAKKIAVERNREIVPRSAYSKVTLQPGDALEIVHFIGGG
jgi:thiazole synthase/sulfur carrier protein